MEDFRKLGQIPVPYLDQLNMQAAYPYSNQMDLRQLFQVDPSQGLAMIAPMQQMSQEDQAKQMYELLQQQQQQQIDPYALAQLYPQQYEGFFPSMFQPQPNAFVPSENQFAEEPKKIKKQYQTKKRQKLQQNNAEQSEIKGEERPHLEDLPQFQKQEFYHGDFLGGDPSQNSNILRIGNQRMYPNQKNENGKRIYIKKYQGKVKRWTKEEALLYEKFIEMYLDIMRDSSSKRNKKIFLLMSKFIGTKSPSQCRSHHQKFFKKVMKQLQKNNGNIPAPTNSDQLELLKMEEQAVLPEQPQSSAVDKKREQKNNKKQIQQLDQSAFGQQQNKLLDISHMPQLLDNQQFNQGFFPGAFNPMLLNQGFFNYQNNDMMLPNGLPQFTINPALQNLQKSNQLQQFNQAQLEVEKNRTISSNNIKQELPGGMMQQQDLQFKQLQGQGTGVDKKNFLDLNNMQPNGHQFADYEKQMDFQNYFKKLMSNFNNTNNSSQMTDLEQQFKGNGEQPQFQGFGMSNNNNQQN